MSRVTIPTAYRVDMIESERGWGQKLDETLYFDNEQEAKDYANEYNKTHNNKDYVPDWYIRAEYRGRVL